MKTICRYVDPLAAHKMIWNEKDEELNGKKVEKKISIQTKYERHARKMCKPAKHIKSSLIRNAVVVTDVEMAAGVLSRQTKNEK